MILKFQSFSSNFKKRRVFSLMAYRLEKKCTPVNSTKTLVKIYQKKQKVHLIIVTLKKLNCTTFFSYVNTNIDIKNRCRKTFLIG